MGLNVSQSGHPDTEVDIDTHGRLQNHAPKVDSDPFSGPTERCNAGLSIEVNAIQLLVSKHSFLTLPTYLL